MTEQNMQALAARRKGGVARAESLSPQRRSEIAQAAGLARWKIRDAVSRADARRRAALMAARRRIEKRINKLNGELIRIKAALQERHGA